MNGQISSQANQHVHKFKISTLQVKEETFVVRIAYQLISFLHFQAITTNNWVIFMDF